MNPNTEYERFTLEVFKQLSCYHHYNIKNVQHDVKLKGVRDVNTRLMFIGSMKIMVKFIV